MPELADRFLHHEHCPQGWVYSTESSTCYRSFDEVKPWKYAVSYCDHGGGRLAQAKHSSSLQTVLEAINLVAPAGEYWLGGKEKVFFFLFIYFLFNNNNNSNSGYIFAMIYIL